jgi:hypothetical protein
MTADEQDWTIGGPIRLLQNMTKDEQEALSRFYAPEAIRLVPLKSGAIAVFNNAKELCGFTYGATIQEIFDVFYPPHTSTDINLADLGLLDDEKRD